MVAHCTREHSTDIYAHYLSADGSACWLAEYADTCAPIGYAVTCPPDMPVEVWPGDVELKRIYAFSRFHGSGVGAALLNIAIEHARQTEASRLLLGTYEDNQRAMAFYTKHGFRTIGSRTFNVGGTLYDDIVMALEL